MTAFLKGNLPPSPTNDRNREFFSYTRVSVLKADTAPISSLSTFCCHITGARHASRPPPSLLLLLFLLCRSITSTMVGSRFIDRDFFRGISLGTRRRKYLGSETFPALGRARARARHLSRPFPLRRRRSPPRGLFSRRSRRLSTSRIIRSAQESVASTRELNLICLSPVGANKPSVRTAAPSADDRATSAINHVYPRLQLEFNEVASAALFSPRPHDQGENSPIALARCEPPQRNCTTDTRPGNGALAAEFAPLIAVRNHR